VFFIPGKIGSSPRLNFFLLSTIPSASYGHRPFQPCFFPRPAFRQKQNHCTQFVIRRYPPLDFPCKAYRISSLFHLHLPHFVVKNQSLHPNPYFLRPSSTIVWMRVFLFSLPHPPSLSFCSSYRNLRHRKFLNHFSGTVNSLDFSPHSTVNARGPFIIPPPNFVSFPSFDIIFEKDPPPLHLSPPHLFL